MADHRMHLAHRVQTYCRQSKGLAKRGYPCSDAIKPLPLYLSLQIKAVKSERIKTFFLNAAKYLLYLYYMNFNYV